MITLSNGHSFEFMTASGALGFDGRGWPWEWPLRWMGFLDPRLFTIVTKTLTIWPQKGHFRWHKPWETIRLIPGLRATEGTVNAMGLPNPGFTWWFSRCLPKIERSQLDIVVSIDASGMRKGDLQNLLCVVSALNATAAIRAIELNLSCPNTGNQFLSAAGVLSRCERAKKLSRHPIVAKLGIGQDYREIGPRLSGVVDAVAINSVPWVQAFPASRSPLARYGGGGVSGKLAQQLTWKMAVELTECGSPPVVWPSIWDYENLELAKLLGASAVSFGSVFLRYPWRPTLFVRRWRAEHKDGAPERSSP